VVVAAVVVVVAYSKTNESNYQKPYRYSETCE
jgi:hypothetical protein